MGRLLTRVREAEERLAGIARALQSAYEEEQREATAAREAAVASLHRAEAMAQAAAALGREELHQRLREVIDQLRANEDEARTRLSELDVVQKTIRARLDGPAPEASPPALPEPSRERTPAPPPPEPAPGKLETPVEPPFVEPLPAPTPPPAGPAKARPASKLPELRQKIGQIGARIDEIEKAAPRLGPEPLRLAVEEHVALARLLADRLDEEDVSGFAEVSPLLERLARLARDRQVPLPDGLRPEAFDDWAKVSADARARRLALPNSRKAKP